MSAPLPSALWTRFQRLIEEGLSGRAAALRLKLSPAAGARWARQVIPDNLATHRNKEAAPTLQKHGCWFLYLPPYSPDLNPSEQAFSKLQAHLRRIGARTFTDVFGAICELYDPQECWNYFKTAGYVSG